MCFRLFSQERQQNQREREREKERERKRQGDRGSCPSFVLSLRFCRTTSCLDILSPFFSTLSLSPFPPCAHALSLSPCPSFPLSPDLLFSHTSICPVSDKCPCLFSQGPLGAARANGLLTVGNRGGSQQERWRERKEDLRGDMRSGMSASQRQNGSLTRQTLGKYRMV